jgi:phosphoribosylanthranilate isomerase
VKVCGITSYEDAAMVLDHGVDALGFNFFPRSPRYISPMAARKIIECLPPLTVNVGLFVNTPPEDVAEMARVAGVQVIQLHGDESPEYCRKLWDWPLIKAVRIGSGPIEASLQEYPVRAFLLDSKDDVLFGGTGTSFDWSRALDIKNIRPVILAGGLQPDTVGEAIRTAIPYAVDVCSGVERAPGKKDAKKLRIFMSEVRNGIDSLQRP